MKVIAPRYFAHFRHLVVKGHPIIPHLWLSLILRQRAKCFVQLAATTSPVNMSVTLAKCLTESLNWSWRLCANGISNKVGMECDPHRNDKGAGTELARLVLCLWHWVCVLSTVPVIWAWDVAVCARETSCVPLCLLIFTTSYADEI